MELNVLHFASNGPIVQSSVHVLDLQWLTEMSTPLEKFYIYFCLTLTRTVNYSLNALTVSFGSLRNMTGVFFIYGYFKYTNSNTI